MYNMENDLEIKRLLKKAVENVKIPKDLIKQCIAKSPNHIVESGEFSTPSLVINKVHENSEEKERTKQIFENLSNSLNKIKGNHPKDWQKALKKFLNAVKKESAADIMTCYLSQATNIQTKNELYLFTQDGTLFPSKMGGLVKRRNIPLLLIDKEPEVFEDAGAIFIFSDSNFSKREKVKTVVSLPFRSNSQRGIVFLSYRRGNINQPEINKLLVNNVPRWISILLSNKQTFTQDKPGRNQEMENRDFAELIKQTVIKGLTDERIEKILKTLSIWLEFPNVFFSWHEIDKENRKIRLRYLFCSEEKEEPITYDKIECHLDENQGIVAEAAKSGTYVLVDDIYEDKWFKKYKKLPIKGTYPEIRSELAIPLNRYDGIHVGVLNLESSEKGKFNERHARKIEEVGQAIIIAAETHNMLNRIPDSVSLNIPTIPLPNKNLAKSVSKLFDTFILRNHNTSLEVSEEVQRITDLALNLFKASAVDIWQYDHEKKEFSNELGLSLSKTFKDKCDKRHLFRGNLEKKFRPRKNGNSQLLMKQTNKIMIIKDAADSSEKHNASPSTIGLNIHGLLGIPIVGPQSTYPDGVMWLRFEKNIDFNCDLIETAQKLAGFIHMLWNPLSYHLPNPKLDISASNQDYFQIGDRVVLTESFMDDDQEYKKNMQGTITGKDSFLYMVFLSDNHRRICVKKESLKHTNQYAIGVKSFIRPSVNGPVRD